MLHRIDPDAVSGMPAQSSVMASYRGGGGRGDLRRYWFVDTIAEIAVRYGISESAVQMRLIRTKNKLAEYLAKEGIAV